MLAYQEIGSGPTVVLFHGVCHRRHAWDAVLPFLDGLRVVTVDLPGHGESPEVPEGPDALRLSADLAEELLDHVTPAGERPHLVGNSLGGWLALELGARGRAETVTAVSPAGFFRSARDQARTIAVFKTLRATARPLLPVLPLLARNPVTRSLFMAAFCSRPWRYPEAAVLIDAPALVDNTVVDRGLEADFTFAQPVDEELPITVLWGRRDLVLPVGQAALVPRVFPQAELEIAPGLGHVPMTDDPAVVAAAINRTVHRATRR